MSSYIHWDIFSVSVENVFEVFDMDYIDFSDMDILTVFSLAIHDHGRTFHSLMSSESQILVVKTFQNLGLVYS